MAQAKKKKPLNGRDKEKTHGKKKKVIGQARGGGRLSKRKGIGVKEPKKNQRSAKTIVRGGHPKGVRNTVGLRLGGTQ